MNLSYETAVKLRDAGFPQKEANMPPFGPMEIEGMEFPLPTFPSLSELIDSCTEENNWFRLHKYPNNGNGVWLASKSVRMFKGFDVLYNSNDPYETSSLRGEGSTPEEAVAALYLAINEKKI